VDQDDPLDGQHAVALICCDETNQSEGIGWNVKHAAQNEILAGAFNVAARLPYIGEARRPS
jgi:hypothetical protein